MVIDPDQGTTSKGRLVLDERDSELNVAQRAAVEHGGVVGLGDAVGVGVEGDAKKRREEKKDSHDGFRIGSDGEMD